jgi:hypothetical protein
MKVIWKFLDSSHKRDWILNFFVIENLIKLQKMILEGKT